MSPAGRSADSSKASSEVGPASLASSLPEVGLEQLEQLRVGLVVARQLAAQLHRVERAGDEGQVLARAVVAG